MRKVAAGGAKPQMSTMNRDRLLDMLGGAGNLAELMARGSRLLVEVKDPAKVAESDLAVSVPRGAIRTAPTRWQILVGPDAQAWAENSGA